jgi:acyl-CoA reductase-like NAD-dependent aldehyde dehydrogenase
VAARPLRIVNPATDEVLRELAADDRSAVEAKLARARAARGAWTQTPLDVRIGALRRFRALVVERTEPLARILTAEVGKPILQSRRELAGLLERIDFFVEHVPAALRERIVLRDPRARLEERITPRPLGVVANVSAWNYPYFVAAGVCVPALLTGNTVLYKPSEYATLSGLAMTDLLHEAGVPEDAFVAVVGDGRVGAMLVEQPMDGVFFTGSHATGVAIARAVAPTLARLQLELGGKDPVYVADDVEVGAAAAAVAEGAFYNTGQSCCAVERVYVHEAVWRPFVEAFVAAVAGLVVGDPLDERTQVGPLARREPQIALLEAQVAEALARGARLLVGGKRVRRPGHFFEPTVLVDVDHTMRVMREESFGPIIGLARVAGDDEALALMSDTSYGLTASVYTRDRERAERILAAVDVGTAYWNCCDRVSPRLPWSGRGASGIGCTLSTYGIEAFLRPQAWHLRSA